MYIGVTTTEQKFFFSFFSSSKHAAISLPDSITLGCHNIPFSDSVRNLGVILDSELSMKKPVIKICRTAYFELKRISSIRRFLTEDATKTLVTSYNLSRLDYCNCLLMGTPNSVIHLLQKVQNFASRLILMAPRHHHSTTLLKSCTGFPFESALNRKLRARASCYKCIVGVDSKQKSHELRLYCWILSMRESEEERKLRDGV